MTLILGMQSPILECVGRYSLIQMGYHSLVSLHTYFQDFAYRHQGRFRMANINIADTPAKTFAEYVWLCTIGIGESLAN